MSAFPQLKTGSVVQYPLGTGHRFHTNVLQFIDGSEQRYALQGRSLNHWVLTYGQLDEGEMQLLRNFVESQTTSNTPFSFTDPDSLTVYANCRLLKAQLSETWAGAENGAARVEIVEVMS